MSSKYTGMGFLACSKHKQSRNCLPGRSDRLGGYGRRTIPLTPAEERRGSGADQIPAGALVDQTTERYPGSEQEVAIAVNDNVSVNSGLTDDETLPVCKDDVGCDLVKSVDGENALDI
jgi:hypothetical protein